MSEHAEHFASRAQQTHAARLGIWLFLASETLLFAALVALYIASRAGNVAAFDEGVRHMNLALGSINTFVLLTSSLVVALSLPALRAARPRVAAACTGLAVLMGAAFLVLKLREYQLHWHEGIYPGGRGAFFATHPTHGLGLFFTLYYLLTGLHALHVIAGMAALAWASVAVLRGSITPGREHPLEFVALYWHLVDVVWIFLWPMLYLVGGHA